MALPRALAAAPLTSQVIERPQPMDFFDVQVTFFMVTEGRPLPGGWEQVVNLRSDANEGLLQVAAGPGNNLAAVTALMAHPDVVQCRPVYARGGGVQLIDQQFGREPLASIPAIIVAAAWGNIEIVQYLHTQHGIPLDTVSVVGLTPLVAAIMNSEYKMVSWLRGQLPGALPELAVATMMPANSPVAMAVLMGDPKVFAPLQLAAADANRYYRLNERCLGINAAHTAVTPLGIALWRGRDQRWNDEDVAETITELLRCGADPDLPTVFAVRSATSTTFLPLQVALRCRYSKCVRALLVAGADPNAVLWEQSLQRSAVDLAVRFSLPDALRSLLSVGGRSAQESMLDGLVARRERAVKRSRTDAQTWALYHTYRDAQSTGDLVDRLRPDRALFRQLVRNTWGWSAERRAAETAFVNRWCRWSPESHWCMPEPIQQLVRRVTEAYTIMRARKPEMRALPTEMWFYVFSFCV